MLIKFVFFFKKKFCLRFSAFILYLQKQIKLGN